MGKPLTQELIYQKTKCEGLSTIKNLNLWCNDLDDLKLLSKLPNIEVRNYQLKLGSLSECKQHQHFKRFPILF